jgi:hypothetical protein
MSFWYTMGSLSGSQQTRWWRGPDSNRRSRLSRPAAGERCSSTLGGTRGCRPWDTCVAPDLPKCGTRCAARSPSRTSPASQCAWGSIIWVGFRSSTVSALVKAVGNAKAAAQYPAFDNGSIMVRSSPPITLKGEPHHSVKSSRSEDSHLRALPDPNVDLPIHTAPDVRLFPSRSCQCAKRWIYVSHHNLVGSKGPVLARPRRVGQHRGGPFVGVELRCQAHARTDAIAEQMTRPHGPPLRPTTSISRRSTKPSAAILLLIRGNPSPI